MQDVSPGCLVDLENLEFEMDLEMTWNFGKKILKTWNFMEVDFIQTKVSKCKMIT